MTFHAGMKQLDVGIKVIGVQERPPTTLPKAYILVSYLGLGVRLRQVVFKVPNVEYLVTLAPLTADVRQRDDVIV